MDGGLFPQVLQEMLAALGQQLRLPQRKHLRWYLFGLLMSVSGSRLLPIAKAAPRGGHRTSCGRFLRSDWDAVSLMQSRAIETLRWMKPGQGEVIYLLIDDTRKEKRGASMEGISKIYDYKSRRFIWGHMIVTAAILFRGVVIPWQFQFWVPRDQAGDQYLKATQIAAHMINQLRLPFAGKVRVLFDSFYLSPAVVKACESQGFQWFSVASKNRKLHRRRASARAIKEFAPGLLRHRNEWVRFPRQRGWRWMQITAVDGSMRHLGSIRMVLSKRKGDPWNKTLAIVTNETNLPAREIISIYEKRWQIEVLFKELRNSLGLCDYQVQSRNAMERHLHLCGMAHQLLTHHSLTAQGAKARTKQCEVSLPPLRERLEALRAAIRKEQAQQMLSKIRNPKDRSKIRRFLQQELQIAA